MNNNNNSQTIQLCTNNVWSLFSSHSVLVGWLSTNCSAHQSSFLLYSYNLFIQITMSSIFSYSHSSAIMGSVLHRTIVHLGISYARQKKCSQIKCCTQTFPHYCGITHTHTCTHTHTHTHMHTHAHSCIHACLHTCTCIHTHAHIHACMHTHTFITQYNGRMMNSCHTQTILITMS